MYLVIIAILIFCAITDYRDHKVRLDLLIICLICTILFRLENIALSKFVFDGILFVLIILLVVKIIIGFLRENQNLSLRTVRILSFGDYLLLINLLVLNGVYKGLFTIFLGLIFAIFWQVIKKRFNLKKSREEKYIPLYPYLVTSQLFLTIMMGWISIGSLH